METTGVAPFIGSLWFAQKSEQGSHPGVLSVVVGVNLLYDGREEFSIESSQQLTSHIVDVSLYNQINISRQNGVPVLLDFARKSLDNVFSEISAGGSNFSIFELLCQKTLEAMITVIPNCGLNLVRVTKALRPFFPQDVCDRDALDGYFVRLIAVVRRSCEVLVWPLPTPPSVVGSVGSASAQPQKEEACKLPTINEQETEQGGKNRQEETLEKEEREKEGDPPDDECFVAIVVQKSPPKPMPVDPLAPPSPRSDPSPTTATVSPTETPVPPSSGDDSTPRAPFAPISHPAPTLQPPGQAEAQAQAPAPMHSPRPITLASAVEPLLKGVLGGGKSQFGMLTTLVVQLSPLHAQEGLMHMESVADSIVGVTRDTAKSARPLFFQVKRLAQREDGSECEFFLKGVRVGDVLHSIQRAPVCNQSFSSIKTLIRQEADKGEDLEFVFTRDEGSDALKAVQRAVVTDPSMAGSELFFINLASLHAPQGSVAKGLGAGAAARPGAGAGAGAGAGVSAPRTVPPVSVKSVVAPKASSGVPSVATTSSSNRTSANNQSSGDRPVIKVLDKPPGSFLVPQLNAPPPNLKKRPAPNAGQAGTKAVSNPGGMHKGKKAKGVECTAMGNLKPLYRWNNVSSAAVDFGVRDGLVYNAISVGGGIRGLRLRYYDPSSSSSLPPTDQLLSLEELRKRMNPKKGGGSKSDSEEEGKEEDSENASSSSSGSGDSINNSDDDNGSSRAPPQKRAKSQKQRDGGDDDDDEEEFDMAAGTGSNPSSPLVPPNQSAFFAIGTYVNCSQLAGTLKHHAMVLAIRDAGTDKAMAQVGWATDGFKAPSGKNSADKDWYPMNGKYMELADDERGRKRRR